MKRFFILCFLFSIVSAKAQVPENIKRYYTNSFEVLTILPTNSPDNFDTRAINQSFRLSASYVIPFGKSNFSFAIGGGVEFHNYYIKSLPKDMLTVSMQPEDDAVFFVKIDSITDPKLSVKRSKMTLTYVGVPFELRYRANNGIKVSVGIKIDFLVNSYFKYKGTDFIFGTSSDLKVKKYNLDNLSNFQICPIVRVGWKWFNVYASYSAVPVFDAGGGNKLNPIMLGISFTSDN